MSHAEGGLPEPRDDPQSAGDADQVLHQCDIDVVGEFPKITQQWESDRGRDSVAANGMNPISVAFARPRDQAAGRPVLSARVLD